jgi:hypothetical protein
MTPPVNSAATPWYRQASKLVTAGVSTGAACVSIFSFLYSFGILGKSESHQTIGNLGVAWVGVRPAVDTATAIGDTLHLAATITDKAGAILVGTRPAWSSENPRVALVGNDGSVVAQGSGATTITVAVGGRIARSRIVVRQRVTAQTGSRCASSIAGHCALAHAMRAVTPSPMWRRSGVSTTARSSRSIRPASRRRACPGARSSLRRWTAWRDMLR